MFLYVRVIIRKRVQVMHLCVLPARTEIGYTEPGSLKYSCIKVCFIYTKSCDAIKNVIACKQMEDFNPNGSSFLNVSLFALHFKCNI